MVGEVQSPSLLFCNVTVADRPLLPLYFHGVIPPEDREELSLGHVINRHPLASPIEVLLQPSIGVILEIPHTEDTPIIEYPVSRGKTLVILGLGLSATRELPVHKIQLILGVRGGMVIDGVEVIGLSQPLHYFILIIRVVLSCESSPNIELPSVMLSDCEHELIHVIGYPSVERLMHFDRHGDLIRVCKISGIPIMRSHLRDPSHALTLVLLEDHVPFLLKSRIEVLRIMLK